MKAVGARASGKVEVIANTHADQTLFQCIGRTGMGRACAYANKPLELLRIPRLTTIHAMVRDLFTYGSLQVGAVMAAVSRQRLLAPQPATLADHSCHRIKGRVYPGLRHRRGYHTEGVLYRGVGRLSFSRLDRFEDSFYRRHTVRVHIASGRTVAAEVYLIPPRYYRLLEPRAWSLARFRARCLRAYLRRCRRRVAIAHTPRD